MTTIPDAPSAHQMTAEAIRQDMLALVQGIRGFTLLTPERRRQVSCSGHVDDDFLRFIALLIEANPGVGVPMNLTAAMIYDHLNFSGAYQGVGAEMMLNGRKMDDTLLSERADIGQRSLHALQVARSISSPAGDTSLVPHLEAIDRNFSRGRRRRTPVAKKPAETPAPDSPKPNKPEGKP